MTEMSNMPSMKSCKLTSLEITSLDMPPENAATTITVDINVYIEETKNNPLLKPVKLRVNLSSDNNYQQRYLRLFFSAIMKTMLL